MSNFLELNKLIKKGNKIKEPNNLYEQLIKHIANNYDDSLKRETDFLTLYYGLQDKAYTLESIGSLQEKKLTRERVRQIIDSLLKKLKENFNVKDNPYNYAQEEFKNVLKDKDFIRLDELFSNIYFQCFKKNIKGLIAFLNDCEIRQIAYRKNYYFYDKNQKRSDIITQIQKENKHNRREQTIEKMSKKAKTVTYVPNEIREYLLLHSKECDKNLNPIYEEIIKSFIKSKPYNEQLFQFSRTKSWRARKGKAQWQQIGIYIDKEVFELIKQEVNYIKTNLNKKVSIMSFICQSFVWYYEQKHK